jgi:hypothetical protein
MPRAPLSIDEVIALSCGAEAEPSPMAEEAPTEVTIPVGSSADDETVAGIVATVREVRVCCRLPATDAGQRDIMENANGRWKRRRGLLSRMVAVVTAVGLLLLFAVGGARHLHGPAADAQSASPEDRKSVV